MIHQIYSYQKKEKCLREGSLGAFVDELATVLLEKGYPKRYLRSRFTVIGKFNRWLIQEKIKLCNLNQPQKERFIQHRSKQTSMVGRSETVVLNFLFKVLRSHGCIPPPETEKIYDNEIEALLSSYNQYLFEEQVLSSSTISNYIDHVRCFLSDLFNSKPINLDNICTRNIAEFVRKYAMEIYKELASFSLKYEKKCISLIKRRHHEKANNLGYSIPDGNRPDGMYRNNHINPGESRRKRHY